MVFSFRARQRGKRGYAARGVWGAFATMTSQACEGFAKTVAAVYSKVASMEVTFREGAGREATQSMICVVMPRAALLPRAIFSASRRLILPKYQLEREMFVFEMERDF